MEKFIYNIKTYRECLRNVINPKIDIVIVSHIFWMEKFRSFFV